MCQMASRIPLNQTCPDNLMLDLWYLHLHPKQHMRLHLRKGRILLPFSGSMLSPITLGALLATLEQ